VRGLDRGALNVPPLADRRPVADLLDAGQAKAWHAFDRRVAEFDAGRAEDVGLRAELDRAEVDDRDAALAAVRAGKPVPPSVRAERALAHKTAQRFVGALEDPDGRDLRRAGLGTGASSAQVGRARLGRAG
jgi:hypothetical protein